MPSRCVALDCACISVVDTSVHSVLLLRRLFLSVFNAVYKFIRSSYAEASVMWKTVRDELECARALLPLVRAVSRERATGEKDG